jgi:hypothetical protein
MTTTPSRRGPRRCGGVFAADGGGRRRHARTPQSAAQRARRPENRRAPWPPHRQDHWRRHAGRVSERRGCGPLCGRGAAGNARAERGCRAGQSHRAVHRHQSRRSNRRGRRPLRGPVNIAARIEALADAGGVFVSNTVHEDVRDRLPFVFEDLASSSSKTLPACRAPGWRNLLSHSDRRTALDQSETNVTTKEPLQKASVNNHGMMRNWGCVAAQGLGE